MNFGSDIQFAPARKGVDKGITYQWKASAKSDYPETIFLNQNPFWFKLGDKRMIRTLRHVFSHEPIHNIIYGIDPNAGYGNYDRLRLKFMKQIKKQCPKTFREWTIF